MNIASLLLTLFVLIFSVGFIAAVTFFCWSFIKNEDNTTQVALDMKRNLENFLIIFFFVSLSVGFIAMVSFFFVLTDSEGGMENWPLIERFFVLIFVYLFEYPLFQTFIVLGFEEKINDYFGTLILLNILMWNIIVSVLIQLYQMNKHKLKFY